MGTWLRVGLSLRLVDAKWPPAVGRRGAGRPTNGGWPAGLEGPAHLLRLSYKDIISFKKFSYKAINYKKSFYFKSEVWLMKADLSLPGWGGWSAPPPSAGGGKAAIQVRMKFVALRLAKQRRSSHMRSTPARLHKFFLFVAQIPVHHLTFKVHTHVILFTLLWLLSLSQCWRINLH